MPYSKYDVAIHNPAGHTVINTNDNGCTPTQYISNRSAYNYSFSYCKWTSFLQNTQVLALLKVIESYSLLKNPGEKKQNNKSDDEGPLIHILALCILILEHETQQVEMLLKHLRGGDNVTKTFMFTKCQVLTHMHNKMLSVCNSAWYSSRKDEAGEAAFINMYIQSPKAGTRTDLGSNNPVLYILFLNF